MAAVSFPLGVRAREANGPAEVEEPDDVAPPDARTEVGEAGTRPWQPTEGARAPDAGEVLAPAAPVPETVVDPKLFELGPDERKFLLEKCGPTTYAQVLAVLDAAKRHGPRSEQANEAFQALMKSRAAGMGASTLVDLLPVVGAVRAMASAKNGVDVAKGFGRLLLDLMTMHVGGSAALKLAGAKRALDLAQTVQFLSSEFPELKADIDAMSKLLADHGVCAPTVMAAMRLTARERVSPKPQAAPEASGSPPNGEEAPPAPASLDAETH